jgi:hypothetical protein
VLPLPLWVVAFVWWLDWIGIGIGSDWIGLGLDGLDNFGWEGWQAVIFSVYTLLFLSSCFFISVYLCSFSSLFFSDGCGVSSSSLSFFFSLLSVWHNVFLSPSAWFFWMQGIFCFSFFLFSFRVISLWFFYEFVMGFFFLLLERVRGVVAWFLDSCLLCLLCFVRFFFLIFYSSWDRL